jgi:hypothetical protein
MDTNAVLIVIGSIFFLLGLAGKILSEKFGVALASIPARVVISIAGILLILTGIVRTHNPSPLQSAGAQKNPAVVQTAVESPVPATASAAQTENIVITRPQNGADVEQGIEVTGTYPADSNSDIWLFVWPQKAPGLGWPQSEHPETGAPAEKRNGKWFVTAWLGGPPQQYELAVYTATKTASAFIKKRLREENRKQSFNGILERDLPDGLVERNRIRVKKIK